MLPRPFSLASARTCRCPECPTDTCCPPRRDCGWGRGVHTVATTAGYSRSSLYPAVLGPAWHELHAAVQRLHGQKAAVRARGTFAVRTGSLPLTRWLCWIAPLPAAG